MILRNIFNIDTDREAMIDFADRFGEALKLADRGRPWCIDLHGDSNTGKSLISLGIDRVFNPHAYPKGITVDMDANNLPSTKTPIFKEIYFYNFLGRIEDTREGFDELLMRIEGTRPHAKALIFGNIKRSWNDDLYYCNANDLNSDRLDIYLDVRQYPKNAPRRTTLVTSDPHFIEAWPSWDI